MADYMHDPEYRPPQVYVNVSGGIAEATVTRGEVDLIVHDWDNLHDSNLLDYELEDLIEMRDNLARIADTRYRDNLVMEMNEVIEQWKTDNDHPQED